MIHQDTAAFHSVKPVPSGGLWYTKPDDAVDYAKFFSRSHNAVIRFYDGAGNVIETHRQTGEFKEW
jgi:hypothetical protein